MTTSCASSVFVLVTAAVTAAAAAPPPQLQIDGGLSVIGVGYEHPVSSSVSAQIETFVFGTYFLPWFDLGQDTKGAGVGVRPTWFARDDGRGLYVSPYVRAVAISEQSITGFDGKGVTAGAFVGWAFALSERFDLRIGGGAQYIYLRVETDGERRTTSTPFVAIDAVLGYRL